MTRATKWFLAALVVTISGGFVATADLVRDTSDTPAYIYQTAPVTRGDIRRIVATTGTVRPRMTVQVGSEISGRIKTLVADFNSNVKAGDLLAVIDPKTFESKARQAKADVLSAEAELAGMKASLRKAKSILENAEKAFARQRALDSKRIAAAVAVEQAERDVEIGYADVEAAEANVANAEAHLQQRKAQHDQAMIDLERTQIRAPIAGIVLHRSIDVGQTVAASFQAPELFRLAGDLSSVHIEAQVGEADIGIVKTGQRVEFDVDAYPRRIFSGTVEQIRLSPSAADTVVTYTVIIAADNARHLLFPGMTANVRIETARLDDVLRVPAMAVHFKPPKSVAKSLEKAPPVDELMSIWVRRLQLDEGQVATLRSALAKKSANDVKGDFKVDRRGTAADGLQKRLPKLIASVLRDDQKQSYAALMVQLGEAQSGSVWVLDRSGTPRKHIVHVGLADVANIHLALSGLTTGDEVIVRSRKPRSK